MPPSNPLRGVICASLRQKPCRCWTEHTHGHNMVHMQAKCKRLQPHRQLPVCILHQTSSSMLGLQGCHQETVGYTAPHSTVHDLPQHLVSTRRQVPVAIRVHATLQTSPHAYSLLCFSLSDPAPLPHAAKPRSHAAASALRPPCSRSSAAAHSCPQRCLAVPRAPPASATQAARTSGHVNPRKKPPITRNLSGRRILLLPAHVRHAVQGVQGRFCCQP